MLTRFSDGTICDYCGNTVLTTLGLDYAEHGNIFCCKECSDDFNRLKMKPKKMGNKWYIEANTEEFGNVLLTEKNNPLPIPVAFDNKEYAWEYVKEIDE